MEKPVSLDRLFLSPGERAEIVVQFQPGDETILHSYSGENGMDEGEFDLIKMVANSELKDSAPLPDQISTVEPIEAPEDAKVRKFDLTTDSKINNKSMDMSRIDEVIAAGSREIWEITNIGWAHNFHIHDAAFRILDINRDCLQTMKEEEKIRFSYQMEPSLELRLSLGTMLIFNFHTCIIVISCDMKTMG